MGFTKLYNEIVLSSIWREDDKTRIVWITLLAIADENGVAKCSIPGLADAAKVSLEDCELAIRKLTSPDPHSRCEDFEGRRIEWSPEYGGFIILNYLRYRELRPRDVEKNREYMRNYMREKRRQEKSCNVKIGDVRREAEADKEEDKDNIKEKNIKKENLQTEIEKKSPHIRSFEEFRKKYPGKKRGLEVEFEHFTKRVKEWRCVLPVLMTSLESQIKEREIKKAKRMFCPEWKNLQTWINQSCWTEEVQNFESDEAEIRRRELERYGGLQ